MNFKKNVGFLDRLFRAIFGLFFVVAGTLYLTGLLSYFILLVGFILIATSLSGYCVIYQPLGINTFNHDVHEVKIRTSVQEAKKPKPKTKKTSNKAKTAKKPKKQKTKKTTKKKPSKTKKNNTKKKTK